jgi:hypothetical protein
MLLIDINFLDLHAQAGHDLDGLAHRGFALATASIRVCRPLAAQASSSDSLLFNGELTGQAFCQASCKHCPS